MDLNKQPSSATTRWGDGRRAEGDFAREQILDAAWHCYERQGVLKSTVEDIARQALVSRTTVYRYFKNRDQVLLAVVERETSVLLKQLHDELKDIEDFGEFMVETMVRLIERAPQFPVFKVMLAEDSHVFSRICVSSSEVLTVAVDFIQTRFEQAVADKYIRDGVTMAMLVEWVIRVANSYISTPEALVYTAPDKRELFRLLLLPAILVSRE